jgi:signal transduction histidine kinase
MTDGGIAPRASRRMSLRTRLTIAVGVVAAGFLGASAWLFGSRTSAELLDSAKTDQFVVAGVAESPTQITSGDAASVYSALQSDGLLGSFYEIVEAPVPAPGVAVEVFDGTQSIVVDGDPDASGRVVFSAPLVVDAGGALLSGVAPGDILVTSFEPAPFMDALPAASGAGGVAVAGTGIDCTKADCDGAAPMVITFAGGATPVQLANVTRSVDDISRSLWIAAGSLTLLAISATWLLAGRVLRPVGAITERVEAIGAAGTGERVPIPTTHDEIGHLARTMNGMLDRLDTAAGAQRRFVADASHELRSPLAVIRTETEVALAHPDQADWEGVARSVLDETNRLEGLVSDLLTLAQHDQRQHEPGGELEPGVSADVEEVVMREATRSRRVPIDTGKVLAGRAAARPSEIARVVRHLVDNAARHAESQVAITVTERDGSVHIIVDDDGTGVAEADRDHIFERFARLEDSRSRDEGGAGLGLAVVASIVDARGGTAAVAESPLGGARFEVTFPTAE